MRQNEGKSEIESDQESEVRKKSEMNLLGWYSLAQMRAWCIRNGALVWLTCRILLLNLVPTPRAHTLGSPLPVRTPLGPPIPYAHTWRPTPCVRTCTLYSLCIRLASYSLCTHMHSPIPVYTHFRPISCGSPAHPSIYFFSSSLFCFCYLFILAYSPSLPTPCV